jgi:hypothetical protein
LDGDFGSLNHSAIGSTENDMLQRVPFIPGTDNSFLYLRSQYFLLK